MHMYKTKIQILVLTALLLTSSATMLGGLSNIAKQSNGVNSFIVYAQETGQQEFISSLQGQSEVPPVQTNATGTSQFELNDDGDEMSYDLEVQDLDGILFAHVHQGNDNENGPILVTLFNESEPTNEIDGELASGDFTADDFEGMLQGKSMTDLLNIINNGNAYVNVHTEANPQGGLRGTIEQASADVTESSSSDDNNNEVSSGHH